MAQFSIEMVAQFSVVIYTYLDKIALVLWWNNFFQFILLCRNIQLKLLPNQLPNPARENFSQQILLVIIMPAKQKPNQHFWMFVKR